MSEEQLKIIIKAITDEAQKNIAEIKKELKETQEQGKKAGEEVDSSLKSMAKGAAVAVAGITAVVGAMVALGKNSIEYQKQQAELVAGFQSVGASAEQAATTYKQLYRYLGDSDTATEAAQQLAQLTQNEKSLTEWTTILQGVYAKYGASIEQAGLAEAINHTSKLGSVQGTLADALEWSGVSVDDYNAKLATTNSAEEREAMIRQTLNSLYGNAAAIYEQNNQSLLNYNSSQAEMEEAMGKLGQVVTPLITQLSTMAATALTELKPALDIIVGALSILVDWIATAVSFISSLFGAFGSSSGAATEVANTTNAIKDSVKGATSSASGLGKAFGASAKQAEKLKKLTMGFDELNVVSKPTSSGGASGGAGGGGASAPAIEMPQLDMSKTGMGDFNKSLDDAKSKAKGLLTLAGLIGVSIGAWKIKNFITGLKNSAENMSKFKSNVKGVGGALMIAAGGFMTVEGFLDAWENGIDWENLGLMVGGLALVVGGLALAFGSLAAQIGLAIAGIALIVIGIIDIVNNGYSMEAVITILVGAVALLVAGIWAFNASLLASPITWIIVGIMAIVAVFIILWNECDGFRQFFIDLWDNIVAAFNAVVDWFEQACEDIAQFFVDAWNGICDAFSAVGDFFSGVWDSICDAFSAVGTWFSDVFTAAWDGICDAFSAVGDFFSGLWNDITEIFTSIGDAIGEAVSNAFSTAVNWVLETAIGIINGFIKAINLAIGVINLIPGVEISKIKELSVPKLAKGGIVDSATLAVIGEQGKEAVMPLENNTGWIDVLAEKLNEKSGGNNQKIVLMLDEKELGSATIGAINNITRQTGKLQLAII